MFMILRCGLLKKAHPVENMRIVGVRPLRCQESRYNRTIVARILYIITSSGVGGSELALWRLLRRLDRARWEATVVSLKPPGEIAARIRSLGIEVFSLGVGDETGAFAALELLVEAGRLPRLLGGRSFDIVHSVLFRAHLLGRLAARRVGARVVVNSYRSSSEAGSGWLLRADRWTRARVTRFHLQSPGLAAALRQRLGVMPGRCVVIPNGIDLAEADAALAGGRDEARRRLGLFPTDLAVACVGRLHPEKGVGDLVGAFRALLQVHPTARLLLAGDGPSRRSLETTVEARRLGPFVRFLGNLADPWPLLAGADIFALPSLVEGMPNALLEAMAAGLPAVATAVGAVPEMVTGGREALVVPPGDPGAFARALAELAAWPTRRREMGALARRRVEDAYRIEATVAQTERLYEELLAPRGRAG
jgi:glycosyltransferase involved in cell wall biosynthesis